MAIDLKELAKNAPKGVMSNMTPEQALALAINYVAPTTKGTNKCDIR